jgi:hypothetical protein
MYLNFKHSEVLIGFYSHLVHHEKPAVPSRFQFHGKKKVFFRFVLNLSFVQEVKTSLFQLDKFATVQKNVCFCLVHW